MVGHEGLPLRDPDVALIGDILALLFKRLKGFLVCQAPGPRDTRHAVTRWTSIPSAWANSDTNSSSVISPLAMTRV